MPGEVGTVKSQSPLGDALDSIRETTTQLHDKADVLMDKLASVRLHIPPPEEEKEEEKSKTTPASEAVTFAIAQNNRLSGVLYKIQLLINEVEV